MNIDLHVLLRNFYVNIEKKINFMYIKLNSVTDNIKALKVLIDVSRRESFMLIDMLELQHLKVVLIQVV